MINDKVLTLFILLLLSFGVSANYQAFKDSQNTLKDWQSATYEYSRVSGLANFERLSKLKSILNNKCRLKDRCKFIYGHFFSYLYFKDVLKQKNKKTYLKEISEYSTLQSRFVAKCSEDIKCEQKVIDSFCSISDKTSKFSEPFCVSLFWVNKYLARFARTNK